MQFEKDFVQKHETDKINNKVRTIGYLKFMVDILVKTKLDFANITNKLMSIKY